MNIWYVETLYLQRDVYAYCYLAMDLLEIIMKLHAHFKSRKRKTQYKGEALIKLCLDSLEIFCITQDDITGLTRTRKNSTNNLSSVRGYLGLGLSSLESGIRLDLATL